MTVTVLLFASYADALGRSSLELALSPGDTVRELLCRLSSFPGARAIPPSPLVAVNQTYARYEDPLAAGDEVAIIPPVAGG